jgi:WD40 repeat protein
MLCQHSFKNRTQKVVSGSWDACVKVWKVALSTGLLSTVPEAEFFDHDTPVQCVSIDDSGKYVAAGAEDGRLCVWSMGGGGSLVFQRQISAAGK